ncbi:helix-turn-helix transcriptional regulator [Methylomonas methanica]|uniref:Regulatory protein LuxR n=1 Tax=Methylomonas methanica (strain DSM 25384 / MC09) TaxID=857087 RepID=G0A511_METMM|nr:helix-turn-helix transcriptional regulator [Methylomonas methanica]AEF99174.1 regulatory protein LuxR [Methylomonas methanica MC09]
MNPIQYDDLIGKIYDAAITPEMWPAFLEQMSETFKSRGTALYLVDLASSLSTCSSDDLSFIHSVRIAPEAGESYDRYYSRTNVWLENSRYLPEGKLTTSDRLFSTEELVKTEWYNDWLKPQGFFHAMVGHIHKKDSLAVRLSIFRGKQQPFAPTETALFARFVPHISRSCMIHKQFSEFKSLQATNTALLNRLPSGVVLFDERGQAVFTNHAAEALIRTVDGFSLDSKRRCLASSTSDTRTLRQSISDAAERGQSRALSLHRHSSGRPLSAIVVSLQSRPLPFIGTESVAALFINDPDSPLELDDKLLMQCYGLTLAEAKLAVALLGGQTPSDYAQVHSVSRNTVKTQLKQILAKTGTHRQAELIQLLATAFGMLSEPKRLMPSIAK